MIAAPEYVAPMINAAQIRAARAMLDWTQVQLATASGVAAASIKSIERGSDPRSSTMRAIQAAFEEAGVVFLNAGDTQSGGPGLRLK